MLQSYEWWENCEIKDISKKVKILYFIQTNKPLIWKKDIQFLKQKIRLSFSHQLTECGANVGRPWVWRRAAFLTCLGHHVSAHSPGLQYGLLVLFFLLVLGECILFLHSTRVSRECQLHVRCNPRYSQILSHCIFTAVLSRLLQMRK